MSILVFSEHRNGKLKKNSFEAVSYASHIAKENNKQVIAITFGQIENDELSLLSKYGANKIINVTNENLKYEDTQAYTKVIAELSSKENTDIIIFSHSNMGKAIAPRLSVRLNAGLAAGVTQVPESVNPLIVKRRTYNGAAFLNIKIETAVKIITINANACDIVENPVEANIENFDASIDKVTTKVEDVDLVTGKILLTEADVVISGGRGLKSGDNWQPIEELAGLLGAGLACSRPVSDEGWRSHDEHVGQTGKIIAPSLYIAVGISGAIQHIGGVSASKVIVAIDKDKDAPIFSYANYGIVGDAFKVLPRLIESVKKYKNS
jgi:electron transfer flavoprotein alpha subunit